jgi:hypothetical protein
MLPGGRNSSQTGQNGLTKKVYRKNLKLKTVSGPGNTPTLKDTQKRRLLETTLFSHIFDAFFCRSSKEYQITNSKTIFKNCFLALSITTAPTCIPVSKSTHPIAYCICDDEVSIKGR